MDLQTNQASRAKSKAKPKTVPLSEQVVDAEQSLAIVKTLLQTGIGVITYLRLVVFLP